MTHDNDSTRREKSTESVVFSMFLVLVFLSPLPLGSNRPWAWSILEVGTFFLTGLYFFSHLGEGKSFGGIFREHFSQVFLLFLWTLVPLFQIVPLPASLLAVLSPATVDVNRFAGVEGGTLTISLDKTATLVEWIKYFSYFLAAFLVFTVARTRERLRLLAWTLLLSGVFQSVFGMFVYFTGPEDMSWWLTDNRQWVHGTYINRNHFAGLLELTIPLGFGLLLGWMRSSGIQGSFSEKLLHLAQNLSSRYGVVSSLLVLMFVALFLSQSRGGSLALVVSLLLVVALAHFRRRKSTRERRLILPVLIVSLIAGGWMGLSLLTDRFKGGTEILEQSGRVEVHRETTNMASHYPLFGTGSGTFRFVFPIYRTEKVQKFNDHAHNDFLEFMSEQGLLGFGLFGAAFLSSWLTMARRYLRRRDPFARGLLFAALTGTLSISLHSLVDFNLQIPANAYYFWILTAMGLQAAVVPHASLHPGRHGKGRREKTTTSFPSELSRRESS
ncbi:MAG: O-antigen ligase family protein [Magnetococcales bacterium]|nr:O-antigen ligase family protein [Magnetococcales bacterium]